MAGAGIDEAPHRAPPARLDRTRFQGPALGMKEGPREPILQAVKPAACILELPMRGPVGARDDRRSERPPWRWIIEPLNRFFTIQCPVVSVVSPEDGGGVLPPPLARSATYT